MNLGTVRTFPVKANRQQAMKILEEASEVFSQFDNSWTREELNPERWRKYVFNECADVIMATCNLLAALGITDFSSYIKECEYRNELRGRYDIH